VEEAAAAAESLQEQAQNLTHAVAGFDTGTQGAAPRAAGHGAQVLERGAQALEHGAGRPGAERRSPNRAANVARLPAKAKTQASTQRANVAAAGGGGEEKWEEF